MLKNLYELYKICKRFQCTQPRPVVGLPFTKGFNGVVALNLKQWGESSYILYMIDLFTKFMLGCFIKNKNADNIINSVILKWLGSGLWSSKHFLVDDTGEFAKEKFWDMCENLNVHVLHTAAESLWQNGVCEHNHALVDWHIKKPIEVERICCQFGQAFHCISLCLAVIPIFHEPWPITLQLSKVLLTLLSHSCN